MNLNFNAYGLTLIFFGVLMAIMAVYVYRRGTNAVRWFGLMMGSSSIWSVAYGLELSSSELRQMLFLINIEYIGIATLPLNWFLFCLSFCDKECWYKKPLNLSFLLIPPAFTLLMVWTNPFHQLHYQDIRLALDGPFPMVDITPGIWYRVFTVYFYILLACGCYLILIKFKHADPIYKRQNYSILVAALIPWLGNILYLVGLRPLKYLDITPYSFILTNLLVFLGTYRFKLFDIVPIAREKVLELMDDGFLILDEKRRIIDYNISLYNYTAIPKTQNLIGYTANEIFKEHPTLLAHLENSFLGKVEIQSQLKGETIYFEAEILVLDKNNINDNITIIKLQDLTSAKKDAMIAKEQAHELVKVNQAKDRIFSIIAHDLRGPMVNLSEVLKMVAYNEIEEDEFKKIAPTLSKDIVYTTDLLENVLHWSRSQLKGFGINKEFFNVRNVILNEINYHMPSARLKKVKILHDVFPNEVAYADVLMFQIVIRNILNNAIKFCNEGCEILITASYKMDGMLKICIKDNGVGISPAVMKRLFTDGNISSRGTNNEKGTGLGLMICKDFMERNGGNITVDSKEDVGSTFCINLPTKAAH